MSEEMQLALEHTLKTMRKLKEAADTITTLRAEVERLGKKLNVARYGEPDFAWSIYEAQMVDLRATNERLRAALKDIRDHSLELYATGVARAALAQEEPND